MKKKEVWECDFCNSQYSTPKEALECEDECKRLKQEREDFWKTEREDRLQAQALCRAAWEQWLGGSGRPLVACGGGQALPVTVLQRSGVWLLHESHEGNSRSLTHGPTGMRIARSKFRSRLELVIDLLHKEGLGDLDGTEDEVAEAIGKARSKNRFAQEDT